MLNFVLSDMTFTLESLRTIITYHIPYYYHIISRRCHRRETKLIVRPCGETRWPHASSPRIITGRSSKNRLPFWSWLVATARTPAPFMDPADRRWYTLQHSCRMVQGSSSWPLWVDATDLCCLCDLMMMIIIIIITYLLTYLNIKVLKVTFSCITNLQLQ